MEKKMGNEMEALGPSKGVYTDTAPTMENQVQKKMERDGNWHYLGAYGADTRYQGSCSTFSDQRHSRNIRAPSRRLDHQGFPSLDNLNPEL